MDIQTTPAKTDAAAPVLAKLRRLGIDSLPQVLTIVPRDYVDFSRISTLRAAIPVEGVLTETRVFSLAVSEKPVVVPQPKRRIVLSATDGVLTVKVVVFDVPGVDVASWKGLAVGDRFHVHGALQSWAGRLQMTSPLRIAPDLVGKVLPRYAGKRGAVTADAIAAAVDLALVDGIDAAVRHVLGHLGDRPENEIVREARLGVPSLSALLQTIHRPTNREEGEAAILQARRLAAYAVVWRAKQLRNRPAMPESAIPIAAPTVDALVAQLPKQLTGDQLRTIREICADLAAPSPMRRVLSGDVGCGKTFAYMVPALATQQAGRQVVVLTPNSLLVEQFAQECRAASAHDAPVLAVTGTSKKRLDLAGNPILVGTTALLSRLKAQDVTPHFLIVDESQKFSVEQKNAMADAGTNLLESTATPIPRTTALVTHGSMDVSIIRECPVAKNIITRIVPADEARRLFDHTRKVIDASGQVAIIYPIVDDEEQQRKSVVAAFDLWSAKFPGRVALLHGALKEDEKIEAIRRLKAGELSVCVSTTVIELGLTMPSLRSVIVVNADRYGVSQLHQLRGRAARLGGTGYFFLYLPEAVGADTMARLKLLEEISDGFVLAERDAQMRGYGDLDEDADRQHGASRSLLFRGIELRPEDIYPFAQG